MADTGMLYCNEHQRGYKETMHWEEHIAEKKTQFKPHGASGCLKQI